MNITEFNVIYKGTVYNCIDMMPEWAGPNMGRKEEFGVAYPKNLYVTCIDFEGAVVSFYDEADMFQFIRKAGGYRAR